MNIKFIFNRFVKRNRGNSFTFAILWTVGLVTGIGLSFSFQDAGMPILLAAIEEEQRPYCVFLANILPAAVVSISLYYSLLPVCYPLFFLEALCHGFCGMLPLFVFGSSGAWLIRSLFLFSGIGVAMVMWWLLMRHANHNQPCIFKDITFAFFVISVISVVDIYVISPQLSNLFIHF